MKGWSFSGHFFSVLVRPSSAITVTTGKAQIDFWEKCHCTLPSNWPLEESNPEPFEENQVFVILSIFVTTGKNRKKHLNQELKRILRIPRNVSFSGFFFFCLFVVVFFEWCSCTSNRCCFLRVYLVSMSIAFHFITRALKLSNIDQSQTVWKFCTRLNNSWEWRSDLKKKTQNQQNACIGFCLTKKCTSITITSSRKRRNRCFDSNFCCASNVKTMCAIFGSEFLWDLTWS